MAIGRILTTRLSVSLTRSPGEASRMALTVSGPSVTWLPPAWPLIMAVLVLDVLLTVVMPPVAAAVVSVFIAMIVVFKG